MSRKPIFTSRRRVLSTVAGMTSLAGCSVINDQETTPTPSSIRISRIEVQNRDDSEHIVEVLLQRGTDLLFWDELQVKAAEEREIQSDCVEKEAWEEPGQYFVRARFDGDSSWIGLNTIKQARDHAYEEESFMNIVIFISKSGGREFRTFNENFRCGTPG